MVSTCCLIMTSPQALCRAMGRSIRWAFLVVVVYLALWSQVRTPLVFRSRLCNWVKPWWCTWTVLFSCLSKNHWHRICGVDILIAMPPRSFIFCCEWSRWHSRLCSHATPGGGYCRCITGVVCNFPSHSFTGRWGCALGAVLRPVLGTDKAGWRYLSIRPSPHEEWEFSRWFGRHPKVCGTQHDGGVFLLLGWQGKMAWECPISVSSLVAMPF